MLAATKVKMSGSEKSEQEHLQNFLHFHVVVVHNSGKEMYKKSVLHVQSCCCCCCFFAN